MTTTYAPGRAELLGNHTDYNEGLVLSLAINAGTRIEATPRQDGSIRLHSRDLQSTWEKSLNELKPQTQTSWVNYVLGVFDELMKRGVKLGGVDFEVSSSIPIGRA
ncbi:MAG: hypothetical protein HC904_10395 [Blastochloris sp.]|nr:hypothetical protein [Blastochloris sp.]